MVLELEPKFGGLTLEQFNEKNRFLDGLPRLQMHFSVKDGDDAWSGYKIYGDDGNLISLNDMTPEVIRERRGFGCLERFDHETGGKEVTFYRGEESTEDNSTQTRQQQLTLL